MGYHHLALAAKDMKATHAFYEDVMGFELVKVEVAPIPSGGWGKHFFYRIGGDDTCFMAFWELHDGPGASDYIFDLNKAANLPPMTNHYAFNVNSDDELNEWRITWQKAGLAVFEIDHNWCKSIYTTDPSGNAVEFCLTSGTFDASTRTRALEALNETEFNPSPAPAKIKMWKAEPA